MMMTPASVIAQFERGEIDRVEMQTMMAIFARDLIREMQEDQRNPVVAWLERIQVKRAAAKLGRRYGKRLLREVLQALGKLEAFPPTALLWNAGHEDVPLECFFRWDREPVFRIREMRANGSVVDLLVEYGREKKRERIRLRRDERWQLKPESRRVVS